MSAVIVLLFVGGVRFKYDSVDFRRNKGRSELENFQDGLDSRASLRFGVHSQGGAIDLNA
jgi:hypothetical protein